MNTENSNKTQLLEAIVSAWQDVPYPGDDNIFTPLSYDDEGITEYFRGTTWQNHKVEELRAHDTAINIFFTPEAYHYWLASYLVAAIEDPEGLSQCLDSLINSFVPTNEEWFKNEQIARMNLLSNNQKKVVINVIEHLAEKFYTPSYPDDIEEEKKALKYLYENTKMA